MKDKFKILSIDGGGVRGIIPARILHHIEERSGKRISEIFDLIVGTSTGGLIALALTCPGSCSSSSPVTSFSPTSCRFDLLERKWIFTETEKAKPKYQAKYQAKDILDMYLKKSNVIFNKSFTNKVSSGFGLWGPRYDRKAYDSILTEMLGDVYLSQAMKPVLLPSYSLVTGKPRLFSSRECLKNNVDYYMRDIAGATSAAPTYFSPKEFYDTNGERHIDIDGGIFANNPASVGAMEAYNLRPELNREDISILSLGTGSVKLKQMGDSLKSSGSLSWIFKANLIDVIMSADADCDNDETAQVYPNFYRAQIELPDNLGHMDNSSKENIDALVDVSEKYINLNKSFFDRFFE